MDEILIIQRRTRNMQKAKGFTLVELMVVVIIVAILASIALPSYTEYVQRSRIGQATSTLSAKRARIEAYFDNNRQYNGAPDCNVDSPADSSFSFSCTAADLTTYTLQAVGAGTMAGFTYTINQNGDKASSGPWGTSENCWITKKGGAC